MSQARTQLTQRYTRYFFLLNLFGFFFLSAQALESESVDGESCKTPTCILSCSATVDSHQPSFTYDLQPLLGVAVARTLETPHAASTADVAHGAPAPISTMPILAVAPKQSPPAFA